MKLPGQTCPAMTPLFAIATLSVASGLLGGGADAHGFLTAPKVEFRSNQEDPTAYSATIDGATALPVPSGMHYDWGPTLAAEAFSAAFGNSSYASLREFVMQHQTMQPSTAISPECGRTTQDASTLQALPDEVVWQHGDNEGFTPSHEGPCEVWCDDERVFADKNCAKMYPHVPAKLPYERAKCVGKTRLQMVWLALHEGTRWQVYMNCAPLTGADAAPSKAQSPSVTAAAANVSTGTGGPVPDAYETPVSSPTPTMKPTVGTSGSSYEATGHHSSARPPMNTISSSRTQAPTTLDGESQRGSRSETDCVGRIPPTPNVPRPTQRSTFRPQSLTMYPTRRVSETNDEGGHTGALLDEDKNIESSNPFAEKATGPVPKEIYEEARKDFEAEQKRKETRRATLKKEFGYA